MSTVLDIIGSTAIAGFVILLGLQLNAGMVAHMDASTATLTAQETLVDAINTLEVDYRKMGYGTIDPRTAIVQSRPSSIAFRADIDRDGTVDVVRWSLERPSVSTGDSAGVLVRQVNGDAPLAVARNVMTFSLSYLCQDGTPADTLVKSQIWLIEVTLRIKGDYKVADAVRGEEEMKEVETFWRQTRLSSRNLRRHA